VQQGVRERSEMVTDAGIIGRRHVGSRPSLALSQSVSLSDSEQ
jgi:hypothetical protein